MNILGVSCGYHDAAVSIINDKGDILFAGHSERYSKIKNDPNICLGLMNDATKDHDVHKIAYYETPWKKQLRRFYSGEGIQWGNFSARSILNKQLDRDLGPENYSSHSHHLSHAAAGFQTSPFDRATVVVIDAIGEWDTISIWGAEYDKNSIARYKRLWRQKYPHSIGLFYSAMTEHVGLKPNEDEYILMGMAAYGKLSPYVCQMKFIENEWNITFKDNLHIGFPHEVKDSYNQSGFTKEDLAHSAQQFVESLIYNVMRRAKDFKWSTNLVYMGGVALNCSANRNIGEYFEKVWILPNPGDAGSSLGAAALTYGKQLNWSTAYLGYNISGKYPVNLALDHLLNSSMVGIANGKAEFGPRALGNRSLLADPRGDSIKDKVNEIKQRQKFRPFAPVILEEYVDNYFHMPRGFNNSRYMQVIATCRFPELFPAIVHVDGTSRVQTVPRDGSGIRELLEKWYVLTGCPMLLNTSLNIKGMPMVNDEQDARDFETHYGVKVLT